jgi:collagenase-like PrtC family protease
VISGVNTVLDTNGPLGSKPEILAPAGGWPQLRAAVQNGADAVYFGLTEFNARARASNFDADTELPEVMNYLHTHGVLGYAVLNVLVFDTELEALEDMVRKIATAGVDAVIVQDLVRSPQHNRSIPFHPQYLLTPFTQPLASGDQCLFRPCC